MKAAFLFFLFMLCFSASLIGQPYGLGDLTTMDEVNAIPVDLMPTIRGSNPPSYSLKKFASTVGNQGVYATCVAWSCINAKNVSYACRRGITQGDSLDAYQFSPEFLFALLKAKDNADCKKGVSIKRALEVLEDTGAVFKDSFLALGCPDIKGSRYLILYAKKYRIQRHERLSELNNNITNATVLKIKAALLDRCPVVISLKYFKSFDSVKTDGFWNDAIITRAKLRDSGSHAMCIVGYNDSVNSGAFEVQNSWGSKWGNNGFCWITYQQLKKFGRYAVKMVDGDREKGSLTGTAALETSKGIALSFTKTTNYKGETTYVVADSLEPATTFKINTQYRGAVYVYAFSKDANSVLSTIYGGDSSRGIGIGVTQRIVLPAPNRNLTWYKGGKELICILYSRAPVDFNKLVSVISDCPSDSLRHILKKSLGRRLAVPGQIRFDTAIPSFTSNATDDEIVALFLELN